VGDVQEGARALGKGRNLFCTSITAVSCATYRIQIR